MKRLRMFIVPLVLMLIVLYMVFALRATPLAKHAFLSTDVQVIAHQGGEGLYPSNTLYAFEHATELGVDMLEMDIHQSKDGHLVIIHDATVDRTTNAKGSVKDMSLAELKALDAGYYWTQDNTTYPYRDQGISIATLEEVFEAFPTMPMVIEIKQQEPSITKPFCELIKRYGREKLTIVGSFYDEVVENFRQDCPEVYTSMPTGEVKNMVYLNLAFLGRLYKAKAHAAQVPMRSSGIPIVSKSYIANAHRKNIAVQVWTINDPQEMQKLITMGVDGIITDRPDLLLDLLERRPTEAKPTP